MRVAALSNVLVLGFFTFVIAYLWASFYIRSFLVTFTVAFLVTCLVCYGLLALATRRRKKRLLTKAESEKLRHTVLQLRFMRPAQVAKLTDCAPLLHKPVTVENVIELIRAGKSKILVEFVPLDVKRFFYSLVVNLEFVLVEDIYQELQVPELVSMRRRGRISWIGVRDAVFNPKKTKGYVIIGVVVLLSSLIVRPTLYYLIFATLIFSIAIISRFRGVTQNQSSLVRG